MANVTYDDKSFLIDGRRIWIVSGSLDYFRIPQDQWEDRLSKAKQAGLNCISVSIAWNYHEIFENKWSFAGQRDIIQFINLAKSLGLFVILKPGPYTGADIDLGGLPPWLAAKNGVKLRSTNAIYTHYFDKYFAQILPKLSELEVTKAGNIVLIQNEHKFLDTTLPDRTNYLNFITKLFRKYGFTVPVITANNLSLPKPDKTIETVTGYNRIENKIKRLRLFQPYAPTLVSQFTANKPTVWTCEPIKYCNDEIERKMIESLGLGAQLNYHMFHGGTNFSFWSCRQNTGQAEFQTTTNDRFAPISESGQLTDLYYKLRPINLLSSSFASYFAECSATLPTAGLKESTEIFNLNSPDSNWAIVTNHGNNEIESAEIALISGKTVKVDLSETNAIAIPYNLRISSTCLLNYTNVQPVGLFRSNNRFALILKGIVGQSAVVSINGKEISRTIPKSAKPAIENYAGLTILYVNNEAAQRIWHSNQHIYFGPDFVSPAGEIVVSKSVKTYYQLTGNSHELISHKVTAKQALPNPKTTEIKLKSWQKISHCHEITSTDDWQMIEKPASAGKTGMLYGYSWYRAEIEMSKSAKKNLFLPACADRALLFLNSKPIGTWGTGKAASTSPIPAQFKKGKNQLVVMVDNLGRHKAPGKLNDPKGLFGNIYDAKNFRANKFKIKREDSFPRKIIPRQLTYIVPHLEASALHSASLAMTLKDVQPLHIKIPNLKQSFAVICNDKPVGFYPGVDNHYCQITLAANLKPGKNHVKFLVWGDIKHNTFDSAEFYTLATSVTEDAAWYIRPWRVLNNAESKCNSTKKSLLKSPAWFKSSFDIPANNNLPVFIKISNSFKGQLFINGKNIGRFWLDSSQKRYFIPSCWLQQKDNFVTIFDEKGQIPENSCIEIGHNCAL